MMPVVPVRTSVVVKIVIVFSRSMTTVFFSVKSGQRVPSTVGLLASGRGGVSGLPQ